MPSGTPARSPWKRTLRTFPQSQVACRRGGQHRSSTKPDREVHDGFNVATPDWPIIPAGRDVARPVGSLSRSPATDPGPGQCHPAIVSQRLSGTLRQRANRRPTSLQCLKDNMASLSPGCHSAVAATQGSPGLYSACLSASRPPSPPPPPMSLRQEAAVMRNACAGDFRAHCRGVGLGGGRALACLADHREGLSPPCQQALAEARAR